MTLTSFLSEFGITNKASLYDWLRRNAKPHQSNYECMVHAWGEQIADKVMRSLECSECHTAPND
jgi:hypothetical protein